MAKLLRIGELGVGSGRYITSSARKFTGLNAEFHGVDLEPPGKYLASERGYFGKNLRVERGKDAGEFLLQEAPESFDHLYAHFTLQHIAHPRRQYLFGQVMRTLKPGAHFAVIEDIHYLRQLSTELEAKGFQVYSRQLSAQELLKIPADNVEMNARHAIKIVAALQRIPENPTAAQRKMGLPSREEVIRTDLKVARKKIKTRLDRLEGAKKSAEAKQAIRQILRDVERVYHEKPFVIIFARKPKKLKGE